MLAVNCIAWWCCCSNMSMCKSSRKSFLSSSIHPSSSWNWGWRGRGGKAEKIIFSQLASHGWLWYFSPACIIYTCFLALLRAAHLSCNTWVSLPHMWHPRAGIWGDLWCWSQFLTSTKTRLFQLRLMLKIKNILSFSWFIYAIISSHLDYLTTYMQT